MVRDPVCSRFVDEATSAYAVSTSDATFYFCSTECMNSFESRGGVFCEWSLEEWKKRHMRQMVVESLLEPPREEAVKRYKF